jgi:hypothetical protein
MVHRTCALTGPAALVFALVGIGAGDIACADDDAVKLFSDQLAAQIGSPGSTEGPQGDGAESAAVREQRASWVFDADQTWSFGGDRKSTDVEVDLTQPFDADALEPEDFSYDSRTLYEPSPSEKLEPKTFKVGESVKLKAQPAGLGGRFTLIFPFPIED